MVIIVIIYITQLANVTSSNRIEDPESIYDIFKFISSKFKMAAKKGNNPICRFTQNMQKFPKSE